MKTKDQLRQELEKRLSQEYPSVFYEHFQQGLHIGPFYRCILCDGLKPDELSERNYIPEAIGHKSGCEWYKAPSSSG